METNFVDGGAPERNFSDIISHAFNTYFKVILWGIILMILAWLISVVISSILSPLTGFDQNAARAVVQEAIKNGDYNSVSVKMMQTPGYLATVVVSYLSGVLLYPLYAGFLYILQKGHHGQQIHFGDLFIGYRQNTLQIMLYGLLAGIIMAISAALCFFPFLFVSPLLLIGLPVVFFENATAVEGIKKSFSIAGKNYGTFLAVWLVALLVGIAGVVLCFVGLVASVPFVFAAMYSAYCAFCGTPSQIKS